MAALRDFYEVLGITDRRCSEDEVKAAYKKAALKWHPDRNHGRIEEATERFKEVGRSRLKCVHFGCRL